MSKIKFHNEDAMFIDFAYQDIIGWICKGASDGEHRVFIQIGPDYDELHVVMKYKTVEAAKKDIEKIC